MPFRKAFKCKGLHLQLFYVMFFFRVLFQIVANMKPRLMIMGDYNTTICTVNSYPIWTCCIQTHSKVSYANETRDKYKKNLFAKKLIFSKKNIRIVYISRP